MGFLFLFFLLMQDLGRIAGDVDDIVGSRCSLVATAIKADLWLFYPEANLVAGSFRCQSSSVSVILYYFFPLFVAPAISFHLIYEPAKFQC